MKTNLSLIFLYATILAACSPSAPEAKISKKDTFTSNEIGWTIEIPKGFTSLSNNRIEANEQKGREAIEKVSGETTKTDSLIHLINFQKNQFNALSATIERFNESVDGDYGKHNKMVKKLIFDTYTDQKIKIDTLSSKEIIKKVPFNVFHIKIYGPNGSVIMSQVIYANLIKGYDFGVAINYNNESDKKALIDAFKNSAFDGSTN
jgi:hypothetical protein